jgi:lipoprotein-anchoring transpeptidase ErfK/SrfK
MNRRNFSKTSLSFMLVAILPLPLLSRPANATRDVDEPFPIHQDDRQKVKQRFRRKQISFDTPEPPGTIIVDPQSKYLYLVLGNGRAVRYGIGVGRQGFEWSGEAVIRRKAKWPRWTPPKEMVERDELAAEWADGMPGGPTNPLGARALYLFQGDVDTLYRIHGTFQPQTIGTAVSSGCIRMINADVADLYERIQIGAKVVVISEAVRVASGLPPKRKGFFLDRLFYRDQQPEDHEQKR